MADLGHEPSLDPPTPDLPDDGQTMKATEVAQRFADEGFDGFEEVKIPSAMVSGTLEKPEYEDSWMTFYEVYEEGDRIVFVIGGDEAHWACPADQEVEVR